MTVGVKYCGGCNAEYERVRAVERIKSEASGHTFKPYKDGGVFDKVIVIVGCGKACAKVGERHEVVYIGSEADATSAIAMLKSTEG
ncbi:MAG: hypothetical protein HN948_10500 [Clostridia bacterium]|jgi:4-hydroxybutyrate CoA-transferase|nr:hypothetical protein [Clostridia bacterium]MBT7123425.1 hypothetical protein [Clostridia bacterium]